MVIVPSTVLLLAGAALSAVASATFRFTPVVNASTLKKTVMDVRGPMTGNVQLRVSFSAN